MLSCEGASVSLGGAGILFDVSVRVAPGEVVVLVGGNGAGKSTLMRLMSGEVAPLAGTVLLDGEDMGRLKPRDLARRRAVMPQTSTIAFAFSAAQVVALGAEAGGVAVQDRARTGETALERVGLGGYGGRSMTTLSGGEAQRVHLARALAQIEGMAEDRPRFLVLDEPTSSLDLKHQLLCLQIARDMASSGVGVLAILHDLNLAVTLADRIVALKDGRVFADGAPARIVTARFVTEVYGVEIPISLAPAPGTPFLLPQMAGRTPAL